MIVQVKVDISSLTIGEKIKSLLPGGSGLDTIGRVTASSLLGVVKKRIHEEGKAADGNIIGDYDKTHPMYVNPKNSPKGFPTQGKTGKTKFETGKKKGQQHATRYFDSYFDFKNYIGRNELGTVNLSLSGQMNNQFVVIATNRGTYGLGWLNTEMFNRAEALEKKYHKPIWQLTEQELKLAAEIVSDEVNKILNA